MSKINWTSAEIKSQKGKVVLITGANSGLGLEAATILSQKEATIVMAVRDSEKGKAAVKKIQSISPDAKPELMLLDLSDMQSIHEFSANFHSKYSRLDILMNNAGVMWLPERTGTKLGFEVQFGVNHLGHFALTGLLLDVIKKTSQARVVTQSSLAHKTNANIHFNDLNWEKSYSRKKAYAQSKLANLLFTYELDRHFKENNINAIAVASHPGVSATNLFRSSGFIVKLFGPLIAQKADRGTLPILRAATEERINGAEFYGPNGIMGLYGYPRLEKSSKKSYDIKLAKDLWSVSEKLTGIIYNFK